MAGGFVEITDSTFSNNVALIGGAIGDAFEDSSFTLQITNSTFTGNQSSFGLGGAISTGAATILTNNTFSGNAGGNSADVFAASALTLYNNIMANAASEGNCSVNNGVTVTSSHNLIEHVDLFCGDLTNGVNGNIVGSDPNLGPLADNGGFTQTMALLAGSPAIDAGEDTDCPGTDQRGVSRPQGSHCDIGAYELENAGIEVTIGGFPMGSYYVPSGSRVSPNYPGINNGPVQVVNTVGSNIIVSERAYRGPNYTDWNEMMGLPVNQLTPEYWFPLYDNTGLPRPLLRLPHRKILFKLYFVSRAERSTKSHEIKSYPE